MKTPRLPGRGSSLSGGVLGPLPEHGTGLSPLPAGCTDTLGVSCRAEGRSVLAGGHSGDAGTTGQEARSGRRLPRPLASASKPAGAAHQGIARGPAAELVGRVPAGDVEDQAVMHRASTAPGPHRAAVPDLMRAVTVRHRAGTAAARNPAARNPGGIPLHHVTWSVNTIFLAPDVTLVVNPCTTSPGR